MNHMIILMGLLIVLPVLLTAFLARLGQAPLRRADTARNRKPYPRNSSDKA